MKLPGSFQPPEYLIQKKKLLSSAQQFLKYSSIFATATLLKNGKIIIRQQFRSSALD